MQLQTVLCYSYTYDIIFIIQIFKIKLYIAFYAFSALMPLGNIHHFLIYTVSFSTSWLHTALYFTTVSLSIYDHFSRTQQESKTKAG